MRNIFNFNTDAYCDNLSKKLLEWAVFVLCMTIFYLPSVGLSNVNKTYSIDHHLCLEHPRHSFFSPDGQFVVVERLKPKSDMKKVLIPFVSRDVSFADLTIFNTRTGENFKIEQPGVLGMSAGPWSPDGKHLAIYSRSDDGKYVSIGVYNVLTRKYRRLPGTPAMPLFVGQVLPQIVWLSSVELIYSAVPEPVLPRYHGKTDFEDYNVTAFKTLQAASDGRTPSAFIYDSRSTGLSPETSKEALFAVNITTASARRLLSGMINGIALAPNNQYLVAYRLTGKSAIPPVTQNIGVPKPQGYHLEELVLVDLQGKAAAVSITEDLYTELRLPVTWSSDSMRVGFYAFEAGKKYTSALPHIYDIRRRERLKLEVDSLVVSNADLAVGAGFQSAAQPVYFAGENAIVATKLQPEFRSNSAPGDWQWGLPEDSEAKSTNQFWLVRPDRTPIAVFPEATNVNEVCLLDAEFYFAADGKAWRGQLPSSMRAAFPANTSTAQLQLVYCPYRPYRPYAHEVKERALFGAISEEAGQILLFDPALPNALPVPIDRKLESLLDVAPSTGDVLIQRRDSTGIGVILIKRLTGERKLLKKFNEWIADIEIGSQNSLSYMVDTPLGPKHLTAWYLMPPGFEPGKRYPVIVNIYPGVMLNSDKPPFDPLAGEAFWSPYAAAAEGYIILTPSTPIYTSDPDFSISGQLASVTLAAVNALINTGIADPDRFAIRGHSAGGYAVASLLTQTKRFKAAIASAGIYNFTSFYGTSFRPVSLDPDGHLVLYGVETTETGQGGMGSPPWVNPKRYILNSPLFHADKINTPLLLLHGESDTVPVQQAEEMFTALLRQQKTARFVRYLGEVHELESPANFRHAWNEMMSWLGAFLEPNSDKSSYSKAQLIDASPPIGAPKPHG